MQQSYSDRSRSVDYRECPRKFWFQYCHPTKGQVPGIVPDKLNMDLTVGITFHEGINSLFTGDSIDEAVGEALGGYWSIVKSRGFVLGDNEDAYYVAYEQASLAEALIRGYHKFVLPQLLERFTIVEAERDEAVVFDDGRGFQLVWGARLDALLMEKDTLNLYVLSLKTKKEWRGPKDEKVNRYDMQGLSETATVEQRLQKWHKALELIPREQLQQLSNAHEVITCGGIAIPEWFITRFLAGASPNIMGVKMEFALKGYRSEYPKGSGQYKYVNPLIRPYRRTDDLPVKRRAGNQVYGDYALRWEFKDEMGGNHTLGKGWKTVNIWEDMGVKEWIDYLASNSIQGMAPGAGLAGQFVLPVEYFRNEEDMARWLRQRLYEERRIAQGISAVRAEIGTPQFEEKLDEHFPMFTDYPTNCTYCEFEGICWGGVKAYLHDPLSSGQFTTREPNHKAEPCSSPSSLVVS